MPIPPPTSTRPSLGSLTTTFTPAPDFSVNSQPLTTNLDRAAASEATPELGGQAQTQTSELQGNGASVYELDGSQF